MPRRISDYPDMYQKWNTFITFGAMFTFFSILFFFYVIYKTLILQVPCGRNPWIFVTITQLYNRLKQLEKEIIYLKSFDLALASNNNIEGNIKKDIKNSFDSYYHFTILNYLTTTKLILVEYGIKTTSLEWTLTSPPLAHTFTTPPKIITTAKHYQDYRWGAVEKKSKNKLGIFAGLQNVNSLDSGNIYIQKVYLFSNLQFSNRFIYTVPNLSKAV